MLNRYNLNHRMPNKQDKGG